MRVRRQQMGDLKTFALDDLVQRVERRAAVDEDGRSARLVREQVRVREPLRMHAPVDQHHGTVTEAEARIAPMRIALALLALAVTASAQAGVRVVAPFDPAEYADRAAVGLLVPGAGPTVTRESALAALLRGKLEHGLLGGIAPAAADRARRTRRAGDPRLAAAAGTERERHPLSDRAARRARPAHVGLDPDRRARLDHGRRDRPAPGRSRRRSSRRARDARRADRAKRPLAPAADDRARGAADRPRLRPSAARAAGAPRRARREPVARAPCSRSPPASPRSRSRSGSRARRSWPRTSSRWGSTPRRSRSRRSARPSPGASTGSTTCSRRCCSRPSLVGAALLGRAGDRRRRARVRDDRRQSLRRRRRRARRARRRLPRARRCGCGDAAPTLRLAAAVAAGRRRARAPPARARRGDRRLQPRHRRGRRRPGRARRRHRRPARARRCAAPRRASAPRSPSCSARSRSSSAIALRARRDAVLDAFLAGLAVSLVVNDTPGDVLGMGAAIAIALARLPAPARPR